MCLAPGTPVAHLRAAGRTQEAAAVAAEVLGHLSAPGVSMMTCEAYVSDVGSIRSRAPQQTKSADAAVPAFRPPCTEAQRTVCLSIRLDQRWMEELYAC